MPVPTSHICSIFSKLYLGLNFLLVYTAESASLSWHLSFYAGYFFPVLTMFVCFIIFSLLTWPNLVQSLTVCISSLLVVFYLYLMFCMSRVRIHITVISALTLHKFSCVYFILSACQFIRTLPHSPSYVLNFVIWVFI